MFHRQLLSTPCAWERLPSHHRLSPHHKARSAPQRGSSIRISLHPHCSEEPPSFLLDLGKDLSLSFPITIHSRRVVALISLIMACLLLDYRHFVVRVQVLFLSATNKTSLDLSCANLLSREASNQPTLFCPLSPATILFSACSVPGGF